MFLIVLLQSGSGFESHHWGLSVAREFIAGASRVEFLGHPCVSMDSLWSPKTCRLIGVNDSDVSIKELYRMYLTSRPVLRISRYGKMDFNSYLCLLEECLSVSNK